MIILIFSFVLTPAFIDFAAKVPLLNDLLLRIVGTDPAAHVPTQARKVYDVRSVIASIVDGVYLRVRT